MSRFFVGQRVRLIRGRTEFSRTLQGLAFVVVAAGGGLHDAEGDPCDLWLEGNGQKVSVLVWQVEPIIPEGHQPARWEDCAWQPEHMRESVRG